MASASVSRMSASLGDRSEIPIPGGRIVLTTFVSSQASRACVIVNCAMSVAQRFYWPFARYLADAGFVAVTWDYRGIGESVLSAAEARRVSLEQWGFEDFALVLGAVRFDYPMLPILAVGHSFGGQIVALPSNREQLHAALLIACPSGYVGHWKGRRRGRFMWLLAHFGIPVLTRISNKFPATRLGLGVDLPRRVALDWGRWLRHPKYLASSLKVAERMASFDLPMCALSVDDDEFAPPKAIDALLELYSKARIERRFVAPAAFSLKSVGHMGFFRQRSEPVLWRLAVNELAELLASGAAVTAAVAMSVPRVASAEQVA